MIGDWNRFPPGPGDSAAGGNADVFLPMIKSTEKLASFAQKSERAGEPE